MISSRSPKNALPLSLAMLRIISTRPGTSTRVVGLTTGISPIPALISVHVYVSEPV